MAASTQRIDALKTQLVARLCSGISISSFTQAVIEVVANSVDAGASTVHVVLNARQHSFSVEDDGCGISPGNFGRIGVRHGVSKVHNLRDYELLGVATLGFRGEALASIGNVAELHISSQLRGSFEAFCKVIKGGEVRQLREGGRGTFCTSA